MVYSLDTNIVIHYLRNEPNVCRNFSEAVLRGDGLVIPKIVDYEIKRGFCVFSAPAKESAYKILTDTSGFCVVSEMDTYAWERAEKVYAELYRKRLTVDEMDILIAAFCVEKGYTLVTNNVKHFEVIDDLKTEDWTREK